MSDLFKAMVIRPAQELSQKQRNTLGINTHPDFLQSNRFKSWMKLCLDHNYESLIEALSSFLNSKEVVASLSQLPLHWQKPLIFAEENLFDFSIKEFNETIEHELIIKDFGRRYIKEGNLESESPVFDFTTNMRDQAIARAKLNNYNNITFDFRNAIKTIDLIGLLITKKINVKNKFSSAKFYQRPLILSPCIIQIDPCQQSDDNNSLTDDNSALAHDEQTYSLASKKKSSALESKKCSCEELFEKEKECCEPEETDCECPCDDQCVEQNPCCAKIDTYVGELFVIRDEVSHYEVGEMARIENVMKDEIREKRHRHLQREENFTEEEEETNTFEERNQQIDERFALHKEVDKVVDQNLSVNTGASYTYGNDKGMQFKSHINATYNLAKKDARKIIQDESKNVITKAISRLEKKTRALTTRKLINEIEEKNKHTFGGENGATTDMSRQFYFVNQVRKAQMYSYGARTMLDFYLPEPSELFKKLLEKEFILKKPQKPCTSIESINPDDYLQYVQCYGFIDLPRFDSKPKIVEIVVSGNNERIKNKRDLKKFPMPINENHSFTVPDGYIATELKINNYNSTHRDEEFWSKVSILVGSAQVFIEHNDGHSWSTANNVDLSDPLNNLEGSHTLAVSNYYTTTYNIVVHIVCVPNPDKELAWKIDVFNRINEKYKKDLQEYEEALEEFQRKKEAKYNQNPFLLSETIKKHLKHSAINYISCQFFDSNNAMKEKVKDCGFPQMNLQEAESEGKVVQFFEQAFEWKFMSYMLYPFSYARKCSWRKKLQEESPNELFTEWLQSGSARLSVSIRPDFELLVENYLQTRHISPLDVPDIPPSKLPIYQEIKESKDNFNAEREGHVIWDAGYVPSLEKNEIILRDNLDYYDNLGNFDLNSLALKADIDREITIDCFVYRIIDIRQENGEIIITLDKNLQIRYCDDSNNYDSKFSEMYENIKMPWATGAKFEGTSWTFKVGTSLIWLREEEKCLPCYPIKCVN